MEIVRLRADAPARVVHQDEVIQRVLRGAREHLGLDLAFISQFIDGDRVFRYVDSAEGTSCVQAGGSDRLEESYCHYVVQGSLPGFLPDPTRHPVSAGLAATEALGVGTHLSVPIRFSDGRVYGTFCCFSLSVNDLLHARDLQTLQMLACLIADQLEALDADERALRCRHDEITQLLVDPQGVAMVFQPLVELDTGRTMAVEALARFPDGAPGPEHVFAEAWATGLGVDLEMKAVRAALVVLDELPADMRLGVNVSPATLITPAFHEAVRSVPPGRLAVEVTEHAAVEDYCELRVARQRLRSAGIRLAIDDVGMGFSGLHHILESAPDTIKIDAAVVRDVHDNPAKIAMIEALVSFGARMDVLVIAEGIETEDELTALRALRVPVGQGYHLGRPGQLDAVLG